MAKESSRYIADPQALQGKRDIVSHVVELSNKISSRDRSLQIGHTAIEDGNLTVRNGDIVVSESDTTEVLRIKHGASPEIEMYPLGDTDTHKVRFRGFDFNSNPDNPDQAVVLNIAKTDGSIDGGKLLLSRGFAIISHQPAVGTESFIWLDGDVLTSEIFRINGRFKNAATYSANQAFICGMFTVPSGVTTGTFNYSSTMSSNMRPVLTAKSDASNFVGISLDAHTTSSFTFRLSTTTGNKEINFWSFRTD